MTETFLSRMPVAKKLLLLVLIPCLLQAFFVCVLAFVLHSAQKELKQVEHQRNALIALKANASMAALALMKIGDSKPTSEADVRAELDKLDSTFSNEGEVTGLNAANYPELKEIIEDAKEMEGEIETLLKQAQKNIDKTNPKTGKKLKRNRLVERTLLVSTILKFQAIAKRIVAAEASTKLSDVERINSVQKTINSAIFAVLGINALITIVFLYLFTKDIAARLKLVAENTHKFGSTDKPLTPCPGGDEIAALDAALQKVTQQLEDFRKQKLAILDNAVDVVFTLDEKLKLQAVNNASPASWGAAPDELVGRSFLSLVAADYRQSMGEQISSLATDEEKRLEAPILIPSGAVKTFEITFSKLQESHGVTGVARDITQQKAVAELKERLLAIVSHDLRTPLASLSITLSVIVEGKRVSDPELRKQLAAIDVSIQHVMALTHDLLSLEKQESELSGISFKPVKAYNVWLQTKSVLQQLCKERNVGLSGPSSDAELFANEEKLVQAASIIAKTVLNLSATDAQMSFNIEKLAGNGQIRIATDSLLPVAGGGQATVERLRNVDEENIFDSENISLSIARAIVEKHNGQMLFDSTSAGGFEIAISVPSSGGAG